MTSVATRVLPIRGGMQPERAWKRMPLGSGATRGVRSAMWGLDQQLYARLQATQGEGSALFAESEHGFNGEPLWACYDASARRQVRNLHFTENLLRPAMTHGTRPVCERLLYSLWDGAIDEIEQATPAARGRHPVRIVLSIPYKYTHDDGELEEHVFCALAEFPSGFPSFYARWSALYGDGAALSARVGTVDALRAVTAQGAPEQAIVRNHHAARPTVVRGAGTTPTATVLLPGSDTEDGQSLADRHRWMCLPLSVEVWETQRFPRPQQQQHGPGGSAHEHWLQGRNGYAATALFMLAEALYPQADVLPWVNAALRRTTVPVFDQPFAQPLPPALLAEQKRDARAFAAQWQPPWTLQRRDHGLGECMLWFRYFAYQRIVRRRTAKQLLELMDVSIYDPDLSPLVDLFHQWRDDLLAVCRRRAEDACQAAAQTASSAAAAAASSESAVSAVATSAEPDTDDEDMGVPRSDRASSSSPSHDSKTASASAGSDGGSVGITIDEDDEDADSKTAFGNLVRERMEWDLQVASATKQQVPLQTAADRQRSVIVGAAQRVPSWFVGLQTTLDTAVAGAVGSASSSSSSTASSSSSSSSSRGDTKVPVGEHGQADMDLDESASAVSDTGSEALLPYLDALIDRHVFESTGVQPALSVR